MDGGQKQLPIPVSEDVAETQAAALYAKLHEVRLRNAAGALNRRDLDSYRKALINGMAQLGYVDPFYFVERFMRDSGQIGAEIEPDEQRSIKLWKLIERKFREFEEAVWAEQPEEELNAGLDLFWSVAAFLIAQGHDVRGGFREVARANDDKVTPDGVEFESDGRVKKPEGWKAPRLAEFLGY